MNYGTFNDLKWIDNVILRSRSKKRWRCSGNGARRAAFASGCPGYIEPGTTPYIEYIGETPSYQTGSHHCMPCAEAFFTFPSATQTVQQQRAAMKATARGIA